MVAPVVVTIVMMTVIKVVTTVMMVVVTVVEIGVVEVVTIMVTLVVSKHWLPTATVIGDIDANGNGKRLLP